MGGGLTHPLAPGHLPGRLLRRNFQIANSGFLLGTFAPSGGRWDTLCSPPAPQVLSGTPSVEGRECTGISAPTLGMQGLPHPADPFTDEEQALRLREAGSLSQDGLARAVEPSSRPSAPGAASKPFQLLISRWASWCRPPPL